jgi:hypothetical protein
MFDERDIARTLNFSRLKIAIAVWRLRVRLFLYAATWDPSQSLAW